MERPERDPYCTYLNGKKLEKEPAPRDPQDTRHTVLKVLFWAAVVLLIAGLVWHFVKPYLEPRPEPEPPVPVETVQTEPAETEAPIETEETEAPVEPVDTYPEPAIFSLDETFAGIDVHVTVDQVELDPDYDPAFPPNEDCRLLRCHVTAENVSQVPQTISALYFSCYVGDEIMDYYQEDYLHGEDRLDEELAPGETGDGWLWFQVYEDETDFLIGYCSDNFDDPTVYFHIEP